MNKESSAEEGRAAERMPEPAPGRRVISFSLPEAEDPPVKKRGRRPKTQKAIDDYVSEADAAAAAATAAAFAAFNAEDYKDLSASPRRRSREAALLLLFSPLDHKTNHLNHTVYAAFVYFFIGRCRVSYEGRTRISI